MVESLIPIMPWIGVGGMVIVGIHYFLVIKNPPGNEVMQAIAAKIYVGAMTFLRREYSIIAIFVVIMFVALSLLLSIWTGVAYFCGAFCSALAGLIGMQAATRTAAVSVVVASCPAICPSVSNCC